MTVFDVSLGKQANRRKAGSMTSKMSRHGQYQKILKHWMTWTMEVNEYCCIYWSPLFYIFASFVVGNDRRSIKLIEWFLSISAFILQLSDLFLNSLRWINSSVDTIKMSEDKDNICVSFSKFAYNSIWTWDILSHRGRIKIIFIIKMSNIRSKQKNVINLIIH